MKSAYTFKHLDYSDSLVEYTDQKLNEIGKFLLKEGRCTVYFWKNNHEFHAEITLHSKEKFFKAEASSKDIYVAVDLMAEKLEKQFLKVKEIYMDHKKFDLSKEGKMHDYNNRFEYNPRNRKSA